MSQIKTLNGVQYTLPQYNDTAWGANTGNVLTQYMAAIADVTLQLSGGSFTLTADVDFGASFGLKAIFKSRSSNIASSGVLRLANSVDTICFRNAANNADLSILVDGGNQLTFGANIIALAATTLTASRAVVSDGSSHLVSSATTAAEIAFVNGVTSAIQTQLNAKATGTINAGTQYQLAWYSSAGSNSVISGSANTMTSAQVLITDANGVPTTTGNGSTTATEIGFVHGVTSAIQTQLAARVTSVAGTANQVTSSGGVTPTIALASPMTTPGAVTVTGNLGFAATSTQGIIGSTTNDSAATGNVGEAVRSAVTNVSAAASGTWGNITSISLTAGDWDVTGLAYADYTGVTGTNFVGLYLSAFTGNTTTDQVFGDNALFSVLPVASSLYSTIAIANWRVSISSTTTIYIKGEGFYSAGTPKFNGRISARRVR